MHSQGNHRLSRRLSKCDGFYSGVGSHCDRPPPPPYGIAKKWQGGKNHGWKKTELDKGIRNEWDSKSPDDSQFEEWIKEAKEIIVWGGNYFDLPPSRGWLVWTKPERNFTLAEAELAWTNMDTVIRVFDAHRSDPDRKHPTQKPVELMVWCLKKLKSKSVIDPYMGSGTTGVAAMEIGMDFIGIEVHEPYFDIACKRLEKSQNTPGFFKRSYEPTVKKKNSKRGFVK